MRIFEILIVLVLCSTATQAQKCKLSVDSTDPITGELVKEAKISVDQYNELYLIRNGESFVMIQKIYELGVSEENIGLESELILKFLSGDTVVLHPAIVSKPQTFVPSGATRSKFGTAHSEYKVEYLLTDEVVNMMSEQGMSFLRLTTQDEKVFDLTIKPKKGEKIKGKMNCLK